MLAESKKGHSMRWISAGFGAVIENKQIYLRAGSSLLWVGSGRKHRSTHSFDVIGARSTRRFRSR
jgi:hypothetical protein